MMGRMRSLKSEDRGRKGRRTMGRRDTRGEKIDREKGRKGDMGWSVQGEVRGRMRREKRQRKGEEVWKGSVRASREGEKGETGREGMRDERERWAGEQGR